MKNNLRVERARVRMTQQELADKTGVTRQTIVAIEQGKFNPSTVLALKMARVFNVTIEALFEFAVYNLVPHVPFNIQYAEKEPETSVPHTDCLTHGP